MERMSRWLVGSSRSSTSGPPTSTCARSTRSLKPPDSVDERLAMRARCGMPSPSRIARGARLERVAVEVRERVLEIGEARRDRPRRDRRCASRSCERAPHQRVAHHREIEDDLRVVEEAILAQDADARARSAIVTCPPTRARRRRRSAEASSCPSRSRRRGRSATPALSCSETSSKSVRPPNDLPSCEMLIMARTRTLASNAMCGR